MPYLIDGHNLIGQLPDLSLTEEHDEAKLVQKLAGFAARTHKKIVVVFDAGLPGGKSRMSTGTVEVIFAAQRTSADRVMRERLKQIPDPANWTVVSGDNEVLSAARQRRMQTLRSAEFARMLQRPPEARKPGRDEASDVYVSPDEVEEWLRLFKRDRKP